MMSWETAGERVGCLIYLSCSRFQDKRKKPSLGRGRAGNASIQDY